MYPLIPLPSADTSTSIEEVGPRIPLHDPAFAADPHGAYALMRRDYGALVPVELWPEVDATLVVGYATAVRILNDEARFPADPRQWQHKVPAGCPILPMLEWRPNALRSVGEEHARYRAAINDALDGVDLHALPATVERHAVPLIDGFCEDGAAELIGHYILPLVFGVLNEIVGCPADIGANVVEASAMMFETQDDADEVNGLLDRALLELVTLKRTEPARDLTTRLIRHRAGLTDTELVNQLLTVYAAGIEPQQNLVANTLLLMLTDELYSGRAGFAPPTGDVIEHVLATDPPLANYCLTYPRQPVLVDGVWLPADEPVMTSMAACSTDPAMAGDAQAHGNWHLGWGTGPHRCPAHAQRMVTVIAREAIDQLLDLLPDLRVAVPVRDLTWRPGAFHRALTALPVIFPKSPPLRAGGRDPR